MSIASRVKKILVGVDQAGNTLLLGANDDTISARLARGRLRGQWWGRLGCWMLDKVQPGHCDNAILHDLARAQAEAARDEKFAAEAKRGE